MPPQISFNSIPSNLRIPLFWAEFDNSQAGVNQVNQRTLLIGQTITAQPMVLTYVTTPDNAAALFGANSMLALMVAAYRLADPFGELWVLPLPDAGASSAATGTITFTGTASAAGALALYIAGQSIPVGVTSGMTAAQIATAAAAAINAVPALPVTASASTSVVTLTADNKGAVGNSIDVRFNYYGAKNGEAIPAGITATIVALSGGATDPDLGGLDPILGDEEFDFIALGGYVGAAQLNEIQTLMNNSAGRWSWLRQVYGHVWSAKMDADATGSGMITFGQGRNDPHLTVVGYEPSPPPPFVVAATYCGAAAVSSKADPARPFQTLALPGLLAPPIGSRYGKSTQQSLLNDGIALMSYAQDNSCSILRSVTTYQKNAFGQADQSYLDAETLFTLMAVTRALKSAITQKFARSKLAADGTNFGLGQNIVTPKSMRAELIAQYRALIDLGLVQDEGDFAKGLIVQINAQDPSRLDVLFDPYLVGGLRIVALLNQFRLQVPATA